MSCSILNFYKFVSLTNLKEIQDLWKAQAKSLGLLGTVLLAPEGVNCGLAGPREALTTFLEFVERDSQFSQLNPKWSEAPQAPFRRLEVKVKRWIIRFVEQKDPDVPSILGAARMNPAELCQRLKESSADFIVVDTRNDYETEVGMFEGAVRLPIKTFTELPDAFLEAFAEHKDKTILFYCTGGVRCEKVVPWAVEHGFTKATQLDGGILKYFEEMGTEGYQGDCFVFDDRSLVDGQLQAPEVGDWLGQALNK